MIWGDYINSEFNTSPDDFAQQKQTRFDISDKRMVDLNVTMALGNAIYYSLKADCPVLTGKLFNSIRYTTYSTDKINIKMSALSYNTNIFKHSDKMVLYKSPKYGTTINYANWLNIYGAFGQGGKDVGWVTRAVVGSCETIANTYGGYVIIV